MKRFTVLAAVSAVVLSLVTVTAASATTTRTLPKKDLFWQVNTDDGDLKAINPNSHQTIKTVTGPDSPEGGYIGGTWDQARKRFILVDNWETDDQGLEIYQTGTKRWTRYAIEFGSDGDSSAFEVRDVIVTRTGKIALLAWDAIAGENSLIFVTELDATAHTAAADYDDDTTVVLWDDAGPYSSIAFDPATDRYIYAMTYDYDLQRLKATDGYLVSRHPVFEQDNESSQFDIDSSRHYWAYGDNGAEMSYGDLSTSLSNAELSSTGFGDSTDDVFIIQHPYYKG